MGNSAVNDILMDDEEEDNKSSSPNTFQDAVKELGNILFKKYPEKTSNLSQDNVNGIIMAEVMNEYMSVNFGYTYKTLEKLCRDKEVRVVSVNGFGVEKIIEFVKSIQASFEQTQLPSRMKDLFNR